MERLTKRSHDTTKENGVCCTHFHSPECFMVEGNCSAGCKWEEAAWERLSDYEDTHMMPSDVTSMRMDMAIIAALFNGIDVDRMKELAEADRAGRLEVLPCKVGDTVWAIDNPWTGKLLKKPIEAYANGMKKFSHGLYVDVLFDTRKINGTRDYEINHIGKTVFLTREGAEAALEAMKDE